MLAKQESGTSRSSCHMSGHLEVPSTLTAGAVYIATHLNILILALVSALPNLTSISFYYPFFCHIAHLLPSQRYYLSSTKRWSAKREQARPYPQQPDHPNPSGCAHGRPPPQKEPNASREQIHTHACRPESQSHAPSWMAHSFTQCLSQ